MIPPITIYTDGLCEPRNPGGYGCFGWVALCDINSGVLATNWGCLGQEADMTNNRAEYYALIFALEHAKKQGWKHVRIRTDSQLVVNQVTGRWACHAPALQSLCSDAQQLVDETQALLERVPRRENEHADALSRRAYAEARRASAQSGRKAVA